MAIATNEIRTDLITPLGAYLRLRGRGPSVLLESVERGRLGRHSFVGRGSRVVGLDEARDALAAGAPVVGAVAYDAAASVEPVPLPDRGPRVEDGRFVIPDVLLRFDHVFGAAEVMAGDPEEVRSLLDTPAASAAPIPPPSGVPSALVRSPERDVFEAAVRRAKEHIRAGDVFQVVLSQRAERRTSASAVDVYRALRRINPSPYLLLLELGDEALVGSSPEALVRSDGRRASVNPIAGTAPVGADAELLASEKDRAEHVMLVDLARNDLSRACRPGTVQVERFLEPEAYSHVTHLVSEVAGDLRDDVGPFELLFDCFPAGTVTGAPKVRAMQLISEIEGYRRGAYAGAVLYALPDGTLDACIAIRMVALRDGVARLQAGAGIVADSDPAAEHRECLAKLAAMEAALEEAESR